MANTGVVRHTVRRARSVARSFFYSIQGPYTSAVFYTDPTTGTSLPVSPSTIVAIAAVYRSLAVYSDLIGTLPVHRYRGEWERLPPPPFVERPSGIPVGWTDEIGQAIWSLLLRGNAYLIVTSLDFTGYPATFYVADPDTVDVELVAPGLVEYRIRPDRWGASSSADQLFYNPSPDQLLHIRWQVPPSSLVGCGILDAGGGPGGTLAGAVATERYSSDLMANPVPPAVLEHPQRLDKQQAEDLQSQWATSIGRARAVPAVLSGGIKFTPLTLTPRDVELIDARKWNATSVATYFGLPPYMVGGDMGTSLTYSTVEGENTRLWTDALQPMAIRLERAIGGAWTPNGQRLRFNPDAILRTQTADRAAAEKTWIDAGVMTPNEARALENMAPLDGGDEQPVLEQEPPQLPALPVPAALPPGGEP